MKDLALLLVRGTTGALLAGHGAQKLFGAFGGPGLEGTSQWLGSMGLEPSDKWALLAGLSELGGGIATALGVAQPLGPLGMLAAMGVAAGKVHGDKPIWVTEGGAELPLTNMAVASALLLAGPGRYSLDELLGTELNKPLALLAAIATAGGVALALSTPAPAPQPQAAGESSV